MEDQQVKVVEPDLYDSVLEGVAQVTGIFAGVVTRYATTRIFPQNKTTMKMVFCESGSIMLSTAAISIAASSVKTIGAYLKPYIVRK